MSALAAWIAGLKGVHARLRRAMLGNDEIECVLAARFFASEYCRRRRHEDSPLQNREAERRKAHRPTMSAPTDKSAKLVCARLRAVSFFFAARPPFGAHACGTRHRLSPRWLSPRTGFPEDGLRECFARLALLPSVKHAPCRPVFLPADRCPRAARERIASIRARAPHPAPLSESALAKGALGELGILQLYPKQEQMSKLLSPYKRHR